MADEKATLPNTEKIVEILLNIQSEVQNTNVRLAALENAFHQFRVETNQRLENLEARTENVENYAMLIMGKVETLEKRIEAEAEKVRLRFVSVEARMERLESMGHTSIAIAKDVRADVMILREELFSQLAEQTGKPRTDRLSTL